MGNDPVSQVDWRMVEENQIHFRGPQKLHDAYKEFQPEGKMARLADLRVKQNPDIHVADSRERAAEAGPEQRHGDNGVLRYQLFPRP